MPRLCKYILLGLISVLSLAMQAETLTLTVEAYNRVSLSGDVPETLVADYSQQQTHPYKGRLQAGESAMLTLSGLPVGALTAIRLTMHSNKAGGAGSLRATVGENEYWQIPDASFADPAWAGAYTTDWVTIPHIGVSPTGTLVLTLAASANSLYLRTISIDYQTSSLLPSVVTLWSAGEVDYRSELYPGQGVVLPAVEEGNYGWHFVGWTETPWETDTLCPPYMEAGSTCYPTQDTELYALYAYGEPIQAMDTVRTATDGLYGLAFPLYGVWASGRVIGARLTADTLEYHGWLPEKLRYRVSFGPDSTLHIQHPASGTWVGYNRSGALYDAPTEWNYRRAADGSLYVSAPEETDAHPMTLVALPDDAAEEFAWQTRRFAFRASATWIMLVRAEGLPEQKPRTYYTTTPAPTALETPRYEADGAQKVLYEWGPLRIVRQGTEVRKIWINTR